MKKGITIISILVAIGAAVVFWFGGFQSGKGETETRWKGEPLEVAAMKPRLPEWRIYVVWEKAPEHARDQPSYTIAPYTVYQKPAPAADNIDIPPFPKPGTWKISGMWEVILAREGTPDPEPPLPETPTPVK
jgi:hypothetical protein